MLRVRLADVSDAPRIVEILRSGFSREVLPYTVFGCDGVERYVRDSIHEQHAGKGVWCVVESRRSRTAGFAEVRRSKTTLFLNHIFVGRSHRGRGIGRGLMFHALHSARDLQQHVELDVLADNFTARGIYHSLGFRRLFEQRWMVMPLCDGAEPAQREAHPEDIEEANRTHQRYGFSEFRLHVGHETYQIGRLGNHLFRTRRRTVLADRPALAALRSLDPERSILCIDRTDFATPPIPQKAVEKARSLRLTAPLDRVLKRLARFAFS